MKEISYAIVHFILRDEVGIVPCSWLAGNKCKWPNLPSHLVDKKVKKGSPPGENCDELDVQVKGVFMTWKEARKVLPVAEYNSDLNECTLPAKRIRRPRAFSSDDEDDDEFPAVPGSFALKAKCHAVATTSALARNPKSAAKNTASCPAKRSTSEPLLHHAKSRETSPGQHVLSADSRSTWSTELSHEQDDVQLASNTPIMLEEGLPIRTTETIDTRRDALFGHRTKTPSQAMPDYEFQQQVLKNLNILRLAIQQQGELLSGLVPSQSSLVEVTKLLENPLRSVEELEAFEAQLTPEREKQLTLELSILGGSSAKVAIRRILPYVITNELGSQYSWEGKKGKYPFKDLGLVTVILRTVHSHKKFAKATRYDIEHEIKEWLRHARERSERAKC